MKIIMENQKYLYLNRRAILAAMMSAAFPIVANAAAGKVEFASGGATIQSADGTTKPMAKGMEINQGDTILTGAGRAQVKFSDGGYISFQPNTQFKIEEYNFNGKQDGTEKGFFRLVEGGLRALTGLVGRENRPAYRMATPVATIGIRGSYYLAQYQAGALDTHVGHGSIFVFNEQGDIILFEGQGAHVENGQPPGYSDKDLNLGARGPSGAQPEQTQKEEQTENQNNDIFSVSKVLTEEGIPASLKDAFPIPNVPEIPTISAIIANLNGINAEGVYFLDPSVANTGGGGGWTTKLNNSSRLYANFGNYSLSGDIYLDSSRPDPYSSGYTLSTSNSFFVSGSILPSGSFGMSSGITSGGVCYNSCTLNMIGMFGGAQAEKASVSYQIIGVNPGDFLSNGSFGTVSGKITGSAGFIGSPPKPGAITNYFNSL